MSNKDFDRMFRKVIENDVAYQKNELRKRAIMEWIVGLVGIAGIVAIFALLLMLGNMAINNAWENLTVFNPGIGWWDSVLVGVVLWLAYSVKGTLDKHIRGRE